MAVDGPGLRKFIQACKDAKAKNLSLVNGFCWRYDGPRRETMKQVFDGKIGDIVAIETTYNSQGVWDPRKTREECASDMEYQMRNWYYYCWLSGDHIVEQAVHGIDTMGWVDGRQAARPLLGRRRPPVAHRRQVRQHLGPLLGRLRVPRTTSAATTTAATGSTRPTRSRTTSSAAKGTADVFGNAITGENKWRYRESKKKADMYQVEHDEMFAAIRAGKPINNGEQAAAQHAAGPHGPHGRLHRRGHHAGDDPQLQGRPEPAQVRVRPAGHAAVPVPGYHQVRLRPDGPPAEGIRSFA